MTSVTAEVRTSTYSVLRWIQTFDDTVTRAYIPYLPVRISMQIRSEYMSIYSKDIDGRLRLYVALYADDLGPDFLYLWQAAQRTRFVDRELSHLELEALLQWIDESYLGNEWITLRFASDKTGIEVEIDGVSRYFGESSEVRNVETREEAEA